MDACKKLVVSCNFQPEYVIEGVLIRDGEFFVNIFKEEWLQNISTPVFPTPIFNPGPMILTNEQNIEGYSRVFNITGLSRLWKKGTMGQDHIVILEYFNIKNKAFSNFAFQSF